MNCKLCGKRSWQVAKFCGNCGARFPRELAAESATPNNAALVAIVQALSLTATTIVLGGLLLFVSLIVSLALLKIELQFIFAAAVIFLIAAVALTTLFIFYSLIIVKRLLPTVSRPSLRHLNPKSGNEIETPSEPRFSITEAETLLFKDFPPKQKTNRD